MKEGDDGKPDDEAIHADINEKLAEAFLTKVEEERDELVGKQ